MWGPPQILTKCRQDELKRGAVLHCWWWEQQLDLEAMMQLDQMSDGPVYVPFDGVAAGNVREQLSYLQGGGFTAPLWQLR